MSSNSGISLILQEFVSSVTIRWHNMLGIQQQIQKFDY